MSCLYQLMRLNVGTSSLRSVAQFEFECTNEEGAVLACTTSADLTELSNTSALRSFLIQYAGAIYQHGISLEPLAPEDSLYIVTGCVKSDGWGLAAYQGARSGHVLRLMKRFGENPLAATAKIYDWVDRGTGEAHLWPNTAEEADSNDEKTHSLFVLGFTLDFSAEFRARLGGPQSLGMAGGSSRDGEHSDSRPSGSSGGSSAGSSTGLGGSATSQFSSNKCSTSFVSGVQVTRFPEVIETVRF